MKKHEEGTNNCQRTVIDNKFAIEKAEDVHERLLGCPKHIELTPVDNQIQKDVIKSSTDTTE